MPGADDAGALEIAGELEDAAEPEDAAELVAADDIGEDEAVDDAGPAVEVVVASDAAVVPLEAPHPESSVHAATIVAAIPDFKRMSSLLQIVEGTGSLDGSRTTANRGPFLEAG